MRESGWYHGTDELRPFGMELFLRESHEPCKSVFASLRMLAYVLRSIFEVDGSAKVVKTQ